jgi:hypothetical protein
MNIIDIEEYFNTFIFGIKSLEQLPKLSRKQIKDNLKTHSKHMFIKLNLYGYYGYYKSLDKYKLKQLNQNGLTMNAISSNKVKYVKYLESRGIYIKTYKPQYIIGIASIYGNIKMLKYFETKMDILKSLSYSDILHSYKTLKYLFSRGLNIYKKDFNKQDLLLTYIQQASDISDKLTTKVFKYIISKGANIYKKDIDGKNIYQLSWYSRPKKFLKKIYIYNVYKNQLCYIGWLI